MNEKTPASFWSGGPSRLRDPRLSRRSGFSLIEVLTVLGVAMVLMLIGFPALQHMILRGKVLGAAEQTAQMMRAARLEAIKRGVTTVVAADSTKRTITAFADINDSAGNPNSDLKFDPPAGNPTPRTVDYVISTLALPSKVFMWCAPTLDPGSSAGVIGLTPPPAGQTVPIAVFNPDGSARNTGSFCFGIGSIPSVALSSLSNGDFLTADVMTLATARITVRKYNEKLSTPQYVERGSDVAVTGNTLWRWNT